MQGVRHLDLAVGEGWLIAYYSQIICVYFGPEISDAEFERYIQRLEHDLVTRPDNARYGGLYYVPKTTAMDSPRRRRLSKVLVKYEDKLTRTTTAFTIATHSPFIRGVLATVFWMAPPGYPYEVVMTLEQGLTFLGGKIDGLDVQGHLEDFMSLLRSEQKLTG